MSSSAFPKILHLGDKAIREIWDDDVLRTASRNLPEWYKQELLKGEIDA